MRDSRTAVMDNLRPLFPLTSEGELERYALRTFRSYARDVIDFIRALSARDEEARSIFQVQPEYRARVSGLLARGRGVIVVAGHYGNWEIGSVLMRRVLQLPLSIVAMAEASPEVNRIRREMRETLGVNTIEVRQSLATALHIRRLLADNHVVAMLMDRHLGKDRVGVTLFGRRAWFLRTPALLACLTGAPLLPCFIERIGPGRFDVCLGDPIFVRHELPRDAATADAAQRVADQLSARVRRHPHFWYHFYRYWDAQQDSYDGLL